MRAWRWNGALGASRRERPHPASFRSIGQQARLDILYDDRLDGRIDETTYDRKSASLRTEVARLRTDIERARAPEDDLLPEMARLVDLSQRAHALFLEAPPSEKRKLLNLLLLNGRWKDGELLAEFRQPFGALALAAEAAGGAGGQEGPETAEYRGWYPFIRRLRELCLFPPPEVRAVFHDPRESGLVG